MELRLRRKLFAAVLVTAAFGLSVGVMYILWARFEPPFFYTALGLYAVLLVLVLLLVGRRPKDLDDEVERDLEQNSANASEVSPPTGMRAPVAVLETPDGLPLQVEKATGMVPPSAPTVGGPAAPTGFVFRGFTLYERPGRTGPTRFFSKGKPVGGGTPSALPAGYEAKWDAKKKRPYLDELPTPEPAVPSAPAEDEFEVSKPVAKMPTGVTLSRRAPVEEPSITARARPCSAFNSPGIMCSRAAREGSPYCAQHAKYKPDSIMSGFEARQDTAASKHKPFRGGVGDFEVRLAKPSAKPLRFKAPTVEVQLARPSTHPAPPPKGKRAPAPAKPARPGKPLRNPMDRPFEVRVGKPNAKPSRLTGATVPEATISRPKAPKPLRIKGQDDFVVKSTKPLAKPVRIRAAKEPVIRAPASLANAKPIKARAAPDPIVRSGPSLAKAKPLRMRVGEDFDVSTARGSLVAPPKRARRCMAKLRNGNRCGNDAMPGKTYCRQHKDFTPRIEAVVVRDTRSRNQLGVGDLDKRRGRR